jgi:hypothetical protein
MTLKVFSLVPRNGSIVASMVPAMTPRLRPRLPGGCLRGAVDFFARDHDRPPVELLMRYERATHEFLPFAAQLGVRDDVS